MTKSADVQGFTRRREVIVYRRFGTTHRSHPHGSRDLFYCYFYYFNFFLSYVMIPSIINTFLYLVYFRSLLLLHSIKFSPIILTLPQGQHLSILRPGLAKVSEKPLFVSLSPPPPLMLVWFFILLIYSFALLIFTVGLFVIYLSSFILTFSSLTVTLFHIVFQTVLAVCISVPLAALCCLYPPLSHPGSTLLSVITPTDCYPTILFQNLRYRLSFLLRLLTC
jgi:hypothetical protein